MPKATLETKTPDSSLGEAKQLTLSQIALDPITDVRKGPVSKSEAALIDNLAKTIFEEGQLQPILVRPNGKDGQYLIVAGRRRFAAKQLIEKHLSDNKQLDQPVTIDAIIVDRDDDWAWQSALLENLQREQFTPMDLAHNIADIRKRKNFNGKDWSKQVAEFLRVSRATVTTHYPLLDLPADIQAKVHRGELSAQSAFDLHAVMEAHGKEKAAEVLSQAERLAEQEAHSKPTRVGKGGKGKSDDSTPQSASKNTVLQEVGKAKVTSKHVRDAARETNTLVKPRTRNEILALFEAVLESADAYPAPIMDLCKTLVTRYATGQVGDRAVMNKLDVIAELIEDAKPAKKKAAAKAS